MQKICFYNATIYTGYVKLKKSAVIINNDIIEEVLLEDRFEKDYQDFSKYPNIQFINTKENIISAGFVDTHIHGFAGKGVDDGTSEAILHMSKELVKYGTTSFFPTIYPGKKEDMIQKIKACVQSVGKEKGARILGIHLEGPFISPEQAGVQKKEYMKSPDIKLFQELLDAGTDKNGVCHIRNMTVAPELKNMRDLALYAQKKDIILQAGHTNAKYENILEGMQVGIWHATHFYNAMSPLHHRNPGTVGAVLSHREFSCEIIADGIHVHPELVKLIYKDKPLSHIVLVTDALRPTEEKSDTLYANGEEVVYKEGIFRRKKDDVIAGSSLTMIKGVKNLNEWGISLSHSLQMASSNPLKVMKLDKYRGTINVGKKADLVIFNENFEILQCLVDGKIMLSNNII